MWFVLLPILTVLTAHAEPRRKQAEAWREACLDGDADVCMKLAEAHEVGRGRWLPQDLVAFRRYLQRACGMDVTEACVRLATSLHASVDTRGRASDLKRVMDLYERGCRLGASEACEQLSITAVDWRESLGLDPKVLRLRHQTACDAGFEDACAQVALVDAVDLGVPGYTVDLESDGAEAFHAVVADAAAELRACYAPRLDWNHRTVGRIQIRLGLDATGGVIASRLVSTSVSDTEIERCALEQLAAMSYPPASEPLRTLEIRLDLKRWGEYIRPLEASAWFEARCTAGDTAACSHLADIDPPAVRAYQKASGSRIVGTLDKFDVAHVIGQQEEQIASCYEAGLGRNWNLEGDVVFRMAIDHTGSVASVLVESSTLDDGGVESCLRRLVKEQAFPAPEGGGMVVTRHTIPLRLEMVD